MNTRQTGNVYEQMAADYLEKQGMRILERNFRRGRNGEIDIIGPDFDDTLHLVAADAAAKVWRNQAGTIEITLDLISGKTKFVLGRNSLA